MRTDWPVGWLAVTTYYRCGLLQPAAPPALLYGLSLILSAGTRSTGPHHIPHDNKKPPPQQQNNKTGVPLVIPHHLLPFLACLPACRPCIRRVAPIADKNPAPKPRAAGKFIYTTTRYQHVVHQHSLKLGNNKSGSKTFGNNCTVCVCGFIYVHTPSPTSSEP